MTKSTITREESVQAVFDLKVGYRLGFADIEILKRVARMALAAMDSEPVAFTEKHEILNMHATGLYLRAWPADRARNAVEGYTIPLYRHAQPAPVVPDAYVRDERGRMMLNGVCEPKIGFGIGWNACRAAMLDRQLVDHVDEESLTSINPAPAMGSLSKTGEVLHTNSPAQGGNSSVIPDTWIPVSERMPPSRHEVLVGCWWGEKPRWCCKWATYIPGHPDAQSSGWLIPGASWTPTHWMPLPAGPKEDINALIPLVSRNEQEGK
ncbi:TPA: DUF551 domain-containing protein [Klebsiella pneumoniae]|nr:DUF551 domain-containing protein [Klebsiella pneumoniae]